MKKIKVLVYSFAFALALSLSFAFKAAPVTGGTGFIKTTTDCDTQVVCAGGSATCVSSSQVVRPNKATCSGSLTMP